MRLSEEVIELTKETAVACLVVFFKTAFVFGQKATDQILQSNISEAIKSELQAAKVYAEGRVIRIDINGESIVEDIHELINFKIRN